MVMAKRDIWELDLDWEVKLVLAAVKHQGIVGHLATIEHLREMAGLTSMQLDRALLTLLRLRLIFEHDQAAFVVAEDL